MPGTITPNQPIRDIEFSPSNELEKTELRQTKEASKREPAENSTEGSVRISNQGREMAKTDIATAGLDGTSPLDDGKTGNRVTEEVRRTKDMMHMNRDAAMLAQGNMNPAKVLELLS